jgi:hypothetical protein
MRGPFVNRGGFDQRGSFNRGGFVSSPGFVRGGGFGHNGGFVRGGGFGNNRGFVRGGGFVNNGGFVRGGGFVRDGRFVRGGGFAGGRRWAVGPTHFVRPYYAFRPRASLGFGLWAGYPFAYPYGFYSPYYYSYPYVSSYGYAYPEVDAYPPAVSSSVEIQPPAQTNMGGVSFELTPSDAELFVDGTLVGTVGQFTPTTQPLGLEAGHHQIEVRASGYQTLSFDVDIIAGQVIPYQGTLER